MNKVSIFHNDDLIFQQKTRLSVRDTKKAIQNATWQLSKLQDDLASWTVFINGKEHLSIRKKVRRWDK